MVASAASLIRTRGASATSFSEVVADSGAPRGSIYHHFPGGKRQLTEDAIRWTSTEILAYLESFPGGAPEDAIEHFVALWRSTVVSSGGTAGCPLVGAAVDVADDPVLLDLIQSQFDLWIETLARQLRDAGISAKASLSIALTAVAAMEGALLLCRAARSSAPLETTARELRRLVEQ
jgi:AcrR family transcriptional regulator